MNFKIIILFIVIIISFLSENIFYPCKKKDSLIPFIISFLHHIGSIYLLLSPFLFNNYLLHLLILIFILCGWLYFKMCVVTIWYNKLCEFNFNRNFHDLLNIFNKNILKIKNLHYYFLFFLIIYDLINIYISYNKKNTSKLWNLYN